MIDVLERLQASLADRYRIDREVGAGGMATVYLAEDLRHSRKVALKALRPELAGSLGAERFLREINLSAGLDHPHIVSVYDSGEAEGILFYTLTFVEGESLRERLDREGQLPIEEVIRITREVASALKYAHDRGVVHRDIKPANVLLHDGHALVADFGIARAVSVAGGERLTRTGIAVGSPLYMSPEQASGLDSVDSRSDQYSLACIVYEMLAGEPPLGGRSIQTILARRTTETPTSLQAIRSSVTQPVEKVVFRALDRTPADRYPDVTQFATALESAQKEAAGASVPSEVSSRAPGSTARWARWLGAAVAIAALGLAFTVFRTSLFGDGRPGAGPAAAEAATLPGVAVLPFGFIGPDSADSYLADAVALKLAEAFVRTGVPSPGWPAVERFKDSLPEPQVLGRQLNVDYLLQGNLLDRGGTLELSVWLTRIEDNRLVWQRTYSGVTGGLVDFEIQIAQTAVDSVAAYAGLPVGRLVVKRYTDDPVADSLYTRALYMSHSTYDLASVSEYIDLARQAVELDSTFAPAYVLLATGLSALSRVFWLVPPREQAPRIRELLEKALEIDPDLAQAKANYGWFYYLYAWEWEAAQALLEQAIALDPGGAEPHVMLAFPLVATGQTDRALASIRKATAMEPYNPLFVSTECWILYLASRYEEAIDRCQFVLDNISSTYPAAVGIRWTSEFALEFLEGEPTEAAVERKAEEILASMPPLEMRDLRNEIGEPMKLAALGRRDLALEILREEIEQPGIRPLRVANTYAWLGDMDEAWAWLERAYEARDPNLAESAVRPEMAPFRADPRWPEFARRMNLD